VRGKPLYWLIAFPALLGLAVLAFVIFQPIRVLPRIALAPGYILTDQDGARLTSEGLRGKVVLYHIGYTGCGAPCEESVRLMQAVQARIGEVLAPEDVEVRLVTISVDPGRDTPEALRSAATRFEADPAVWHLATGEEGALKTLVGAGLKVYYTRNDVGGFRLDPAFFLVDGWGILRAEYRYRNPRPELVLRDIELVVREARAATGMTRLAYEAAHLFACYPTR
jgi:protein SCO1/2